MVPQSLQSHSEVMAWWEHLAIAINLFKCIVKNILFCILLAVLAIFRLVFQLFLVSSRGFEGVFDAFRDFFCIGLRILGSMMDIIFLIYDVVEYRNHFRPADIVDENWD